ncbi:MAG: carboxypeptidase-like regulatory domain-containing protein, partial [Cytophagaceae bacterium]
MNYIRLLCLTLIVSALVLSAQAQDKLTVNGYVKDASDGEGLIGVSVYSKESGTGAVTNNYGFYAITLPKGTYTFVVSYVGYEKQTRTVTLTDQNVRLDLELKEEGRDLKELVVSATDGISKEAMGDVETGDLVKHTLGDAGKGY